MKVQFQIYNPYLCPRCKHYDLNPEPVSDKKWRYMGECKAVKQEIRECPDYGLSKAPPACDFFVRRKK